MARRKPNPRPTQQWSLQPLARFCKVCGGPLRADYTKKRVVRLLTGVTQLQIQIRRCQTRSCPRYHHPVRPEVEKHVVLPKHEFGLGVIALAGKLRYVEHRSVPEIRAVLRTRGLVVAERTVTHLLERYDELVALRWTDTQRLRRITTKQGRVVLALDGLQPEVGQEVLWVIRDSLSGEVLLARSLLSARHAELAALLKEVKALLRVPIIGVVSDGERSIRKAVAAALPGVPHQLCHFHYLREAARPLYEADRHAKKLLKKKVRGVRPLERQVEGRTDPRAQLVQGYCAAVRSALTDDRRPPLGASGLRLHQRLGEIAASMERAIKRGARSRNWTGCTGSWGGVCRPPRPCGPPCNGRTHGSTASRRSWTTRTKKAPPGFEGDFADCWGL